jgi:hypothetical protein
LCRGNTAMICSMVAPDGSPMTTAFMFHPSNARTVHKHGAAATQRM